MRNLTKRFLSASLTILLILSLALTAVGGAEIVICYDCAGPLLTGENHMHDAADAGEPNEHEYGADSLMQPVSIAVQTDEISGKEEQPIPIAEPEASAVDLPTTLRAVLSENAEAQIFYQRNRRFTEKSNYEFGAHSKLFMPSGELALETELVIKQSIVSADVAFYLAGETLYRRHLATGATDMISGLEHIKRFYVRSNTVVRWIIQSDPACNGMNLDEIYCYNENDPFPFICYEYDFESNEVKIVSRESIFEEEWELEQANSSSVSSQETYVLYGVTLPLAEFGSGKYYSKSRTKACNCHGANGYVCRELPPSCDCQFYRGQHQCNGFSRYVLDSLLGSTVELYPSPYADINVNHLNFSDKVINTASEWQALIALIPVGSRIRFFRGNHDLNHYIILLQKDSSGIVLYDANGGAANQKCIIRVSSKSYADIANSGWEFRNYYDSSGGQSPAYFETVAATHDHHYDNNHQCYFNGCTEVEAHDYQYSYTSTIHTRVCSKCGDVASSGSHSIEYHVTNTNHTPKCDICQYQGSAAAHQNVDYTPLQSGHRVACAVCGTTTLPHSFEVAYNAASHYALCSYCGYVNTAVSEDHSFAYADVDDTVHRRYCTGCGYGGNSSHAFSAWISSGSSSHKRTCSLCGREVTQAHVFGAWSNFSASQHRSQCSACSHYRYGNHGYGSWGQYSSSRHQRSCVSCGRYDYASHTFGSWSSLSATQHRRTCNACGYNNDASHSFSYEQIPNNRAAHRVNCSTCGYSAVQPHLPDANGYCIRCGSYTGIHLTGVGENEQ